MTGRRSRRSSKGGRRFLLAGTLILAVSLFAQVQTKAKPADQVASPNQKPIRHEVGVSLKLIQVVVTGKDGKPVTDLKKEDFVLLDNGEEKKLTEFERHDFRVPAAETKPSGALAAQSRPPGRKFFLLFDFTKNWHFGILHMAEAAGHFMDTVVLPGDEVAVITLTADKLLQVPIDLTTDREKIKRYAAKIGQLVSRQKSASLTPSSASAKADQVMVKGRDSADAGAEGGSIRTRPEPRAAALDETGGISDYTYVDCLTSLAIFLRSVPGAKHLLLFSMGIRYDDAYPLIPTELTWKYENLIKEMATANIAVHALRTGGIAAGDTHSGAWTLAKTSYETGGQYWGNMYNDRPFLEKVRDMAGAYYVLGYPVRENWDGKFHKIKVSVTRPGCEVRTPSGFFNPKDYANFSDPEKWVQLIDLALAEKPLLQEPLRFPLAGLTLSNEPVDNIGIAAEVPLERLREQGLRRVEILALAFNDVDEIVDSRRTEEDFRAGAAPSAVLASFLSAPPGPIKCRVVIRDMDTGKAAVAGCTALVPDPAKAEFRIYPPLLLRSEGGRPQVKEPKPAKKNGLSAAKTPAEAFFLDPARYAPDFPESLKAQSEAWAVVTCLGPPEILTRAALTLTLMDEFKSESRDVPLIVAAEKRAPGSRVFLIHFRVPEVEPDDYLLIFGARGPDGPLSQIARRFGIESK